MQRGAQGEAAKDRKGLWRLPQNKSDDNGAHKLLKKHVLMNYLSKQLAEHKQPDISIWMV